jgi:hypothetical protein
VKVGSGTATVVGSRVGGGVTATDGSEVWAEGTGVAATAGCVEGMGVAATVGPSVASAIVGSEVVVADGRAGGRRQAVTLAD